MTEYEYVVDLYQDDRKVGGFVTADSARVNCESARWQAKGANHTVQMLTRPRRVDQAASEEIPANEYLCQE